MESAMLFCICALSSLRRDRSWSTISGGAPSPVILLKIQAGHAMISHAHGERNVVLHLRFELIAARPKLVNYFRWRSQPCHTVEDPGGSRHDKSRSWRAQCCSASAL